MSAQAAGPDDAVVDQAIQWLMRLQSGRASPGDWEAFRDWRAARDDHAVAWDRLQGIQARFAQLPPQPTRTVLDNARKDVTRRRAMRALGVVLSGGVVLWLVRAQHPVDRVLADYSTGVGEQLRVALDDGSVLVLGPSTHADVRFDANERRIVLRRGRLMATTGADAGTAQSRPFFIETGDGRVRALGTRFSVALARDGSEVQVFEDAVRISPASGAAPRMLEAGQRAWFDAQGVREVEALTADADAWTDGLLVARDMKLSDLVAELAPYRRGHLACDAEVAGLRISGVFSLADTDRTLSLIEKTLPVRVATATRYWVTLKARAPR